MAQVKNKQAEKSRQTQRRVLTAAHELFVDGGYGQTALQDVADRAGVSVQTIYFLFRTKRNLLKNVVDVTVAGDDEPVATMERPWFADAMNADAADDHLRAHVIGTTTVLERAAPITDVLRTAAGVEPELDELWQRALADRRTVQHATAEALLGKPGARTGITVDRAADLLFALLSPELYLLLVRDRAWTCGHYRDWVHDTLAAQLLDPAT